MLSPRQSLAQAAIVAEIVLIPPEADVKSLPLLLLLSTATAIAMSAQTPTTRDSAGIRVVTFASPLAVPRVARRLAPTPATTLGNGSSPDDQFGSVAGAVRLSDGSIVVVDGKSIEMRLFSPAGKFIRKIGRNGEGPGDFRRLGKVFVLPGDTLLVWDGTLHRTSRFTPDGTFRGTQLVERVAPVPNPGGQGSTLPVLLAVGLFRDGTLFGFHTLGHFNPPTGMLSDSISVDRVSTEGKIVPIAWLFRGESYSYHSTETRLTSSDARPFTTHASLVAGGSTYWYTDGLRYEVREFAPSGKLLRILRIAREPVPVTEPQIEGYRKSLRQDALTQQVRDSTIRPRIIAQTELLLKWLSFPRTNPAFTAMVMSRDGEIWAREMADSTRPQRWDLFDANARFQGIVEVPADLVVLEIGHDYLLARAKDQDDVETVRLYRFVK